MNSQSDPHEQNIQQTPMENDDLAKFGYKQQLFRTLNLFSTFGLAFSYISPVVGVYTLFGLGLCTSGPSFIWGIQFLNPDRYRITNCCFWANDGRISIRRTCSDLSIGRGTISMGKTFR